MTCLRMFAIAAIVVASQPSNAIAQVLQCVKDPNTGRWISPVEGQPCSTRPAPPVRPTGPIIDLSRSVTFASPELTGDVSVIIDDGRVLIGDQIAGSSIPFGSRIVTGPTGRMRVTLPDGSVFTMGAGSELAIDEFLFDPDPGLRRITLNLVKGFFRWATAHTSEASGASGEIGKPHVRVRVGTIGFRGTDCEIFQDPGGSGYVKLFEGEVAFSAYDSATEVILHAGEMISFDEEGKVTGPAPIQSGA